MKKFILIAIAGLACLMAGCIKNDIPYPRIQPNFLTFSVADQLSAPTIDSASRTVSVSLDERADIRAVNVESYSITPGSRMVQPDTLTVVDLSSPITVTLGLYQDYDWTISASQTIQRYMAVKNQIGATIIDVPTRRMIVTVPENIDLSNIYVDSIKIGPADSTMTPDLNGQYADFTYGVAVDVTSFGETTTWHLYADVTEATVFTTAADAWTQVAWIYGEAEAGKDNGFEYRPASSAEWLPVPDEWIEFNGGTMVARLIHLQPETEYAVRAVSDNIYANELVFTTQSMAQMPDSSFDLWSLNGKVWQPWAEGQTPYWDTGNIGATTLGTANVTPTDITSSGTGQAALLKTEFKGIGSLGKLAAGSLFAGSFVRTDGTNGILSFGRTFTQRPTKLTGYFKYHTEPISNSNSTYKYLIGRPDTCIVWVALIDSEEPFEIRTNPNNLHLFNPNADDVIAYGSMQVGYDVTEYTKFEIELDYKSTSRIPRYILCVTSSSKYGDYFTGGVGSVMYVDDYQLLYDY